MEMKTQTQKRPWLIVLIGGCLICFIGFIVINMSGILPEVAPLPTNTPKPTVTIPPTVSPAQTYFEQYGGNINVYIEIFQLTDCSLLQEKFDIAAGNNATSPAGSAENKWTLGYMVASDERMKSLGCY